MTRKINDPVPNPLLDKNRPINKEEWPLTATASFTYSKPASLSVPASGEISHATDTMNKLRVSSNDAAGADITNFLFGVGVGDTIQVGATTWTVQAFKMVGSYFEFTVTPASQAAVAGAQSTSFVKL